MVHEPEDAATGEYAPPQATGVDDDAESVCSSAHDELGAALDDVLRDEEHRAEQERVDAAAGRGSRGAREAFWQNENVPLYMLLPQYLHEKDVEDTYLTSEAAHEIYGLRVRAEDGLLVDANDMPLARYLSREAIYAIDGEDGSVRLAFVDELPAHGRFRHSSLVAGAPVAAAGLMTIRDGHILEVSNESGHYMPSPSSLQTVMRRLAQLKVKGIEDVELSIVYREAYDVSDAAFLSEADGGRCISSNTMRTESPRMSRAFSSSSLSRSSLSRNSRSSLSRPSLARSRATSSSRGSTVTPSFITPYKKQRVG